MPSEITETNNISIVPNTSSVITTGSNNTLIGDIPGIGEQILNTIYISFAITAQM